MKISVVTVCYNAVQTLEKTMLSVLNQTYPDVEYIIIDGGSTDGTVDIIKKYADRLAYWVSEPDKGIYDAMNKGIKVATGEWINFMNAGDTFFQNDTVVHVHDYMAEETVDVIYGNTLEMLDFGYIMHKPLSLLYLKKSMIFFHQSCFVKTRLMKMHNFDLQYKICADYNFFYNLFVDGRKFLYTPLYISRYDAIYGVSSNNRFTLWRENAIVNGDIRKFSWWSSYCLKIVVSKTKDCIKLLLPSKGVIKWKRYRNRHRLVD